MNPITAAMMSLAMSTAGIHDSMKDLGSLRFGRRAKRQKTAPAQRRNRKLRNRARGRVARASRKANR